MMSGPRNPVVDDPEVWLGVHDASAMLGVSPATLRRWSAAGQIEAFTTPGGHRRYARSMLERLLHRGETAQPSAAALGESAPRMVQVVRRHLHAACEGLSWVEGVDDETRCVLGLAGRAMVDGLLGYIDAPSQRERLRAIEPAMEAAALHGRVAARCQGDLGETVAAFHRFRGLFVDDLADLACQHDLGTQETTRLLGRANDGVDRLIVALVDAQADTSEALPAAGW